MKTVGERMQYVLDINHDKCVDCAKKLGMTDYNLSRYMNGKRIPNNDFLKQFATLYKIDLLWLVYGDNSKKKDCSCSLDDIENKESFYDFLETFKEENFKFLRGETDYKEPMVMKSYRIGVLNTSRKTMKKLMIEGYKFLGYRM